MADLAPPALVPSKKPCGSEPITACCLLISSSIGLGFSTLPFIGKEDGLLYMLAINLIGFSVGLSSALLLAKIYSKVPDAKNYVQLSEKILGPNDRVVALITNLFYLLGNCIIFCLFFTRLFSSLLIKLAIIAPPSQSH
jgi:amino acid permease